MTGTIARGLVFALADVLMIDAVDHLLAGVYLHGRPERLSQHHDRPDPDHQAGPHDDRADRAQLDRPELPGGGVLEHAGQHPGSHDRRRDDDDVQPERSLVPRGAALPADPVADQQPGFQCQPRRDGQLHCHFDHPLKREGLPGAGSRAPSVALSAARKPASSAPMALTYNGRRTSISSFTSSRAGSGRPVRRRAPGQRQQADDGFSRTRVQWITMPAGPAEERGGVKVDGRDAAHPGSVTTAHSQEADLKAT